MHTTADLAARRGLLRHALAWASVVAALIVVAALLPQWARPRGCLAGRLWCWPAGGAAGMGLAARQQPTHTPTATHTPTTPSKTPGATATPKSAQAAAPDSPHITPTPSPTLPPAATAPARPGCVLYPSGDVPRAIPDNLPAGVASSVTVPQPDQPLTSVGVRVDELRHPYVGDLRLTLVSPGGASLILVDQVGNDTDDFYRTEFYDAAPAAIASGVGPFTGPYQPDQSLAPLNGQPSGGLWQLHVGDLTGGDSGTLYAWSLELCAEGPLPPPPVTASIPPTGGVLALSFTLDAHVAFPASGQSLTATLATTGTHALPVGAASLGGFFVLSATNAQGAAINSLDQAVQVTVHYADADVPGHSEAALKLLAWDHAAGAYLPLPTTRDPQANTLSANLSALTEFGAVAQGYELFLPSLHRGQRLAVTSG